MATEQETARAGGGIVARPGCFNWRLVLNDAPRHRRRLYGRLVAMFFTGCGVLGLGALPVPASGLNAMAAAALSAAAFALGIATWVAPWDKWPRQANLGLAPPAFALMGLAYLLPLLSLHENVGTRTYSTALTIPLCALVGEGTAWTTARLEKIELALREEKDQTERLRELDETKDKLLSSVSHELRNPITICRGHLDLLEEGAGKRELRAAKETLIDELDLMGRLIEDLITLARAEPSSWRFEVADEGGGLALGDEQVVFEPFRTGSPGTRGTGLGLSIVRGIAKAHGGESDVVNRPGRGATFWIRVPR
jgi:signal transduction histidine kinase